MIPGTASLQKISTHSSIRWIDWYDPADSHGFPDWSWFRDLENQINTALIDPGVSSLVISSPGAHFSSGWNPDAWLKHSPEALQTYIDQAQRLMQTIETAHKPVIAAVHGRCLGPGMELILACHAVVATIHKSTVFGVEERNLGLVPALGATVRLPALLGLQTALHMLLSGRTYTYQEAASLGLVHLNVVPDQLLAAAGTLAESLTRKKRPRRKSEQGFIQKSVERLWVGRRLIIRQTSDRIQDAVHPSFVAPELILQSTDFAWKRGAKEGLSFAADALFKALGNPGTQALLQLRNMALRRQISILDPGSNIPPVRRVTILGGGKMGMGLVSLARQHDLDVHLVERSRDRLQILSNWVQRFQTRLFDATTYFPDQAAEFIIESVDENEDRKTDVLQRAEKYLEPDGFLATNTSTLSVTQLASSLQQPGRLVGMHFFMPPGAMPLVEIIPGGQTSGKVLEQARRLAGQLGKVWIQTKDTPGFFCTRVLGVYLNEALALLEEGADLQKIDYVLRQFGFTDGPFHFMDMAGLDLIHKVLEGPVKWQMDLRGDRVSAGLQGMVMQGCIGNKTGRGFYLHHQGQNPGHAVNPDAYQWYGGQQRRRISTVRIQHRMVLALVNEAVRCLEEGVIALPEDGDLGAVYGLGFPAFVGGPFRFADQLGLDKLVHMLEELREDHGPRFEPPALLREKVNLNLPFYQKNSL